jgi:hypothetical protein
VTPVKTNKKRSPYSTRGTGGGLHTYQASRLEGLEPLCSGAGTSAGTSAGNVEETASLSTPWAALTSATSNEGRNARPNACSVARLRGRQN